MDKMQMIEFLFNQGTPAALLIVCAYAIYKLALIQMRQADEKNRAFYQYIDKNLVTIQELIENNKNLFSDLNLIKDDLKEIKDLVKEDIKGDNKNDN